MQTIITENITISNVNVQNVKFKCECPRCKTITFVYLVDYTILNGKIDCVFCANDGWDDCLMPLTEIEITFT